jgi:hypothetical protein
MMKMDINVGDRWICHLGDDVEFEYIFTVIAKIRIGKKIYFPAVKTTAGAKHSWPIIFDQYGRQANDDYGLKPFRMLSKAIFYKKHIEIIS